MTLTNNGIVRPGERTNAERKPVNNKILLSILDSEFLAIRSHLEFLDLPHHLSLYEPNQKIEFAYFPN
jgi:hypothetical protein